MASLAFVEHRNQDATCYVGNLDPLCTEELLTELFAQVGRVQSVYMPKADKLAGGTHSGYGFVEFLDIVDADYAIAVLNMVRLFGRPLRVSKSALQQDPSKQRDIGAKLFVGNLDPNDVDEQLLYDTFFAFGTLTRPCVLAKDDATGQSKGYAFVSYDSFQASDTAIDCLHGQYLGNRQITVQYALKKDADGKTTNERHGTRTERMLAEAQQQNNANSTTTSAFGVGARFGGAAPPPPPPPMMGVNAAAAVPPPPPPPPPPPGLLPPLAPPMQVL